MIDKGHAVEAAKHAGDWIATGTIVAALLQVVPLLAAVFALIYHITRWTETPTARALIFKTFGFDLAKWRKIDGDPPPVE